MKQLWRWVRAALAALGLLVLVVQFSPLVLWWATQLAGAWDDPRGDVLIVLGASVEDQRVISQDTYLRAIYAVLAWREGGFRKIVVCGNGPAQMMREFLTFSGVPAGAILAETKSLSTRENALEATALLAGDPGVKVLMTSDFHMYRARRVFRKAGLAVLPRPIPDVRKRGFASTQRWAAFIDLLVETTKIAYYWSKGWI